jgi:hypothetical protein
MNATTGEYKRIGDRATPEAEKRWLSWTVLVRAGRKGSYVRPSDAEIAKRRARGKRQRLARKANRVR